MTRLSNRQYPMLTAFADEAQNFHMPIADAQKFDQRPFRSMLIRQWIVYTKNKGFYITDAGKRAWREFHETDIARKHFERPLTAYFDPTAYGLAVQPKKVRAVEIRRRGAA